MAEGPVDPAGRVEAGRVTASAILTLTCYAPDVAPSRSQLRVLSPMATNSVSATLVERGSRGMGPWVVVGSGPRRSPGCRTCLGDVARLR